MDTIMGLPIHILVLHVVVVLGPIAALVAIAYAAKAAWRPALKWPLAGLALATGIFGLITGSSGESLEHRLTPTLKGNAEALALLHDHTEMGDTAEMVCLIFMVIALAAVFYLLPAGGPAKFGAISAIVLVLASLAAIGSITLTGHSGAKSAWADTVATTTNTGGGDGD